LVGESDNGVLLSETEYRKLQQLAVKASKNRLFVVWRNTRTGMDCYNVGPDSRCFCGHSYKAHAWYNTDTKKVHCRCQGCKCKLFRYINGHGSFWIKCACHHDHVAHRWKGAMGRCRNGGCDCEKFHSHFSCSCGYKWECHKTIFEGSAERRKTGRDTENLCGANPIFAASSGAITNFSSLIPGAERKKYDPASLYYKEVQGIEKLPASSITDNKAI